MKSKTSVPLRNRPKSGINKQNQKSLQSEKQAKYEFDESLMSPQKIEQLNQTSYTSSQKKVLIYIFPRIQQVTIRDLCPEDKAKIGELIKRLAEEKESKEKLVHELKDKVKKYQKTVHNIKKYSESVIQESKATEEKFKASLEVIKQLQQQEAQKNKENKIQNNQINNSPPKRVLIQQLSGESENKISSISKPSSIPQESQKAIQNINVNSFNEEFPLPTKAVETRQVNIEQKSQNEILKLKAEIEEITNSLKELHFAKYQEPLDDQQQLLQQSPSFSADNKINFAKEFKLFEQKVNSTKQQSPKLETYFENIAPKILRQSQDIDNSSDSEENEIEIAKKLLSLKKQKIQQVQEEERRKKLNYNKFERIKEEDEIQSDKSTTKNEVSQKNDEAKILQKKFESQLYGDQQVEEIEKLNKNLDKKLQSLMGTSQSYSLSFNLSQNQNDQTPQNQRSGIDQSLKFTRTREIEVNKFIDSAIPSNKKKGNFEEGTSSLMSTPQPLNNFPQKQIEPEKQTGFSFKQPQIKEQNDEIDDLIESLNSRNFSKKQLTLSDMNEGLMKSNSTLKSKPKNQEFYGQNLLDVINSIDRPEKYNQSSYRIQTNESFQRGRDISLSQSSQYQKLMDKYSKLAEEYNNPENEESEKYSDFDIDLQR